MAWIYQDYNGAGMPPGWSESTMQNNAREVYNLFTAAGYTLNAISGILGNMEVESWLNPGQGEGGGAGYGLCQWTPKSHLTYWTSPRGYADNDGYGQCLWIRDNMLSDYGWFTTTRYPISWTNYQKTTMSPGEAAMCFFYNFERGTPLESRRRESAQKWYDYFSGVGPGPTPGGTLPVWLMALILQNNNRRIFKCRERRTFATTKL